MKDVQTLCTELLQLDSFDVDNPEEGVAFFNRLFERNPEAFASFFQNPAAPTEAERATLRCWGLWKLIVLSIKIIVKVYSERELLQGYARDLVDKHHKRGVTFNANHWKAIFSVFLERIIRDREVGQQSCDAWNNMTISFVAECERYYQRAYPS